MGPAFTKCLSRVVATVGVTVLSCSTVIAQVANQTAPLSESAPVQSEKAAPLPNAPDPNGVAPPDESLRVVEPEFSSSSSSPLSPAKPKFWTISDPNGQVTVLENTMIRVMTNAPLSSRQTREGVPLLFTLSEDVVVDDVLIIPRGAAVHGTVVQSKQAGTLTGSPELILKLTSLDLGGRRYQIYSYQFKVEGTSKTKPTETKIRGGAVVGAIVGGVFSGSSKGQTTGVGKLAGIGTGAALGAGVGTVVSAVTPGPILTIPAESEINFYLASPISVVPVSPREAALLSQGLRHGGPVLYVRGDTP